MEFISHHHNVSTFWVLMLFFLSISPVFPTKDFTEIPLNNQNFQLDKESQKMKLIKAHLTKNNRPYVKSIQSPDGDIIDCVLIHHQPSFDYPVTMVLDPPVTAKEDNVGGIESEIKQLWSLNGDSCPDVTIPIRRIREHDILRSISIPEFGKKISTDSDSGRPERAMLFAKGKKYYGAQASLNVWDPNVTNQNEFSISQIWIAANTSEYNLNTLQAGWQVNPGLYGDNSPRLFTYWTNDGYKNGGCYDLLCPGFVQTSKELALGGTIQPVSTNNGHQFQITLLITKDQKNGKWWLRVGSRLLGYWPANLFLNLDHATLVGFGGEVFNSRIKGQHTSTQMGSGHFPDEGFKKAAFVKNISVVDEVSKLHPVSDGELLADRPNCYDVRSGFDTGAGNYIFYGGPGKNPKCP